MSKKFFKSSLSILLIFLFLFSTIPIYAANEIKIEQTAGTVIHETYQSGKLSAKITNTSDHDITGVVAKLSTSPLTYAPYSDAEVAIGTLRAKESKTVTWDLNTSGLESNKTYKLPLTVTDDSGNSYRNDMVMYVYPNNPKNPSDEFKLPKASISITSSAGKLNAGSKANLNVIISNVGNTLLNDVNISFKLPEGVTPNNTNLSFPVGSILSGKQKSLNFPVSIDSSVEKGNYAFEASITALDHENKSVSFSQTSYIPIESGSSNPTNIQIGNISLPGSSNAGSEFNLSFNVTNNSSGTAKNVKITVTGQEGLVNKTKNIFTIPEMTPGLSKSYSVTFFSLDNVESKNIPIEIKVEYSEGKETISLSQYEGIFIKGKSSSGGVKTPQLIVTNYTYGGQEVLAGSDFKLNYTILNTSKDKALRNIKIVLTSDEGYFIPVQSSNTMYIDSIGVKGSASKSITLNCKPNAEQKTVSVNLDMTYEDTNGNEYTAKEMISVPVVQKTKLRVDEIQLPTEIYVGQVNNLNVDFYNLGKTVLSNLTVTAEGDFSVDGTDVYFVGNMDIGKQDNYSLSFIPNNVGSGNGKLIFSYEDVSGESEVFEKEFTFNAIEMPPMEPEGEFPPVEEQGMPIWQKIGIGAIPIIALIILFIIKRNKKKKEQELTIDEE